MSIENDIEGGRFSSDRELVLVNLVYTSNFLINRANKILKQYDFSHQQFMVLRILRDNQGESFTINMIKKNMLDQMSDVSRIVNRLEHKAYISRSKGLDDKREVRVRITRQGVSKAEEIEKQLGSVLKSTENLSEEDVKSLNILLNKIRKSQN